MSLAALFVWLARSLTSETPLALPIVPSTRPISYRTKDGTCDYQFSIERQPDGTYRAFIVSQPSYQSRATGAHETHRLTAGGRRYVCWTGALRTDAEAKAVAALWADATQEYIKSGQRF